ncbi:MAG TPA: hypothetical protein VGH33_07415, partial [Isosphaeraceae bacterium]
LAPLKGRDFKEIRLWVKAVNVTAIGVRISDGGEQCHQKNGGVRLADTRDWQPVILKVSDLVVVEHRRAIDAKHHSLNRRTIEEQLQFEPGVETTNRKPLRQPAAFFAAQWEIRFGPGNRFRVLYEIDEGGHEVHILAIGEKEGNRLRIGGEEIEL